ncbi:MAG: ATP-binding cassette domain-containing protein [Clostridia bacterium]|nr:ATP-binding cassette domain-containing protein [Clostridia bacterium]
MLNINGITKIFAKGTPNEHMALNNLSLNLDKGEFVTIVGSNGAGKSTLFNAICGTFFVDNGTITLDGRDITYLKEHKRSKIIGRVFQDPMRGTAPNLTIEENIALAYARVNHGPLGKALNKKDVALFKEKLKAFDMGLEDRMKTKVGLLSGGQRQVVTLLMCTIVPPKLLLLDEHTAALDPATSDKIMKITNDIIKEFNLTTLMITHNINSALKTGTRTIMMDEGQIILDISGEERKNMQLNDLLTLYSQRSHKVFDNDRMLFNE